MLKLSLTRVGTPDHLWRWVLAEIASETGLPAALNALRWIRGGGRDIRESAGEDISGSVVIWSHTRRT